MSTTVPPGWGDDPLTSFFDEGRKHSFASHHRLKGEFERLRVIDSAFVAVFDQWLDPENTLVAPLAIRAHSAFRAAAQLSLAGQLPEAYMVMRGCIEHALYGNYIDLHRDAWNVWSKRGDDEAARKLCVRTFSGRNLFDSLRARDHRLGEIAGQLYERTIDFGAHPNELGVGSTMDFEERPDGGISFAYTYLSGDGMPLRLCLKSLAQTGLIVLDILCLIFPKRFAHLKIPQQVLPVKAHV